MDKRKQSKTQNFKVLLVSSNSLSFYYPGASLLFLLCRKPLCDGRGRPPSTLRRRGHHCLHAISLWTDVSRGSRASARSSCCCQLSRALSVRVDWNVRAGQFTGRAAAASRLSPKYSMTATLQTSSSFSAVIRVSWSEFTPLMRGFPWRSGGERKGISSLFAEPLWCSIGNSPWLASGTKETGEEELHQSFLLFQNHKLSSFHCRGYAEFVQLWVKRHSTCGVSFLLFIYYLSKETYFRLWLPFSAGLINFFLTTKVLFGQSWLFPNIISFAMIWINFLLLLNRALLSLSVFPLKLSQHHLASGKQKFLLCPRKSIS